MKTKILVIVGGTLWLVLVVTGLAMLFRYQSSPGVTADPPNQWPKESRISRTPGRPTLLMLVHPQCPCSRASMGELAILMTQCQGKIDAHVLFFKPDGFPANWEKSDLWTSAERIPGVEVLRDERAEEARLFHATTSGQTLFYDGAGKLQFSGGITAGRGHSGDNAGRDAIVALVTKGQTKISHTEVYGCSLSDPSSTLLNKESCCKK